MKQEITNELLYEVLQEVRNESKADNQNLYTALQEVKDESKADNQNLYTALQEVKDESKADNQSLREEFKSDIKVLHEYVKDFKGDVNRRFDEQDKRMDRIEDSQQEDHHMLMDIWKSRDKVTARVTFDFLWKAVAVNSIVLVAVGHLFFGQ